MSGETDETQRPVPADKAAAPSPRGAETGPAARLLDRVARWRRGRSEKPGLLERAGVPLRWRKIVWWTDRVLGGAIALGVGVSLLWTALYGILPLPGTLLMGQRQLEGETVYYGWRGLDQISPNLVRAVIAAEDTRFCAHAGFDLEAIQTALQEAERGERLRGASTISQQTAKNAYLFSQRSWVRKAGETWFTMLDEAIWPKRRTMEVYLNIAEWGDGLFGAEAAARGRFGKSAADLTAREAALLAAVLPNPNEWALTGSYVAGRAGTLQQRMNVVAGDGLDSCVLR